MTFRLCDDEMCESWLGSDINRLAVQVIYGTFHVELGFEELQLWHDSFNGQRLWLAVEVGDAPIACQEILPVPYALSLRAGAVIDGDQEGLDALKVENMGTGPRSYGLYATSAAAGGRAVTGLSSALGGAGYGVYAASESQDGAGLYARGWNAGADIILGGNGAIGTQDDGRLLSDPAYAGSEIFIISSDSVRIDLNENGDTDPASFRIVDQSDTASFEVDEGGSVTYSGALVGAFPRPAWDSDWGTISAGTCSLLSHDLGGDADDYVVDLQFKDTTGSPPLMGIHNYGYACDTDGANYTGGFWRSLTNASIVVCRCSSDDRVGEVRVRIWVYQ
jgi:hypothetical protein